MTLGCVLLASCSQLAAPPPQGDRGPSGMHELDSLYTLATAPQGHDVRKPVRDQRERAMRLLAQKTDALLAETSTWDRDARLTSLSEPQRDCVQKDVRSLREALTGLETAAKNSDLARVRSEYAEVQEAYRHLQGHIPPNHS